MKKKILIVIALLTVLVLAITCSGCAEREKDLVVFIPKSKNSSFWNAVKTGIKSAVSAYNMDILISAPDEEDDFETQNVLIENAINMKAQAICLSAIDYEKCGVMVDKAIENNIKVVIIDSGVQSKKPLTVIGTDNKTAGAKMAQSLLNIQGEINIGIINSKAYSKNLQDREEGFCEEIKEYSRMKVVEKVSIDMKSSDAEIEATKMIKSGKVNAIVTFNEIMTIGVGEALRVEDRRDIFCVGFDNHKKSVQQLEEGYVDVLIVQNPIAMGYMAIEECYNQLKNISKSGINRYTPSYVIDRSNMYLPENQKILFPIIESAY